MANLVNLCLYELGWFACVLGAAGQRPWLGMAVGLACLGVHLALVRGVERQLALIAVAGAMGWAVDSLLMSSGVLRYPNWTEVAWLAPPWDVVLWLQFATILPFCLRWLSRRYRLCSLAGLVGGPLAFYAGERFGAVTFLPPRLPHYAALAVVWSVAFPTLVWVSDRLIVVPGVGDRYRWLSRS
jgi:hypothetical protein